jgi:nucleoside-diphosphate-sugar epimerase
MKILLVGGTSFLAQALLPVLGHFAEVVTAGRAGCDLHLDLSAAPEDIAIPKGIDVVINAAASFDGATFEAMLQAEKVNVCGVLKLCHACAKAEIRQLVLISSIFECLEASSPFYSIYSLSKRQSEEVARLYCSKFGLPLTILRPSQMYGTGEGYRKHQPFLFSIVDKAANGEDIELYDGGGSMRNYIHVEDVARILGLVVQRGILGTFACMSGENTDFREIAREAIQAFGSKSKIRLTEPPHAMPDNIFKPDDTLFQLLGFYPRISMAEGMKMEAARRKSTA